MDKYVNKKKADDISSAFFCLKEYENKNIAHPIDTNVKIGGQKYDEKYKAQSPKIQSPRTVC